VHGLEYDEELDEITGDDGALAAFREAKEQGLIDHMGLTSHGDPGLILDALDRIDDLESVMSPESRRRREGRRRVRLRSGPRPRRREERRHAGDQGVRRRLVAPTDELPEADRPFANWYRPVTAPDEIRERFDFAAAQGLTSVINAGDPKLVTMILEAAADYDGMDEVAQRSLIERVRHDDSPVPEQLHH